MPNFDKIMERLHKLESLRLEPVDSDLLEDALATVNLQTPIQSIEESFDTFVQESAFVDEEIYSKAYNSSPYTYGDYYVQSPELIDLINSLPFNLQQSLPTLRKQKKVNQAIVYNKAKSELIIVKKDDVDFYLSRGYNLIDERVTYEETISGADTLYTDGTGKVSGYDKPLFTRNRRELSKFKGKVFELPPELYKRLKKGRKKYESWNQYIEEDGDEQHISAMRTFSLKNSGRPIVIQNTETGERAMLRRRYSDNRLQYNRRKRMN